VEQFIPSQDRPPEEIILDFDAADDPVHRGQERRFFHCYYDNYCFLPLYVFCGDQLLVSYLRPWKIDVAKHSRAIRRLLVRRFRQVWPNVKTIFGGDSEFCLWRLFRCCDKHVVNYLVGLAKNAVLKRLKGTELAKAQAGTIRLKLLKIAARITCSIRRIVLNVADGYPLKELFASILSRLRSSYPAST